eukprot:scaffold22640_cov138-Cylindrotheca_fusiformis.AAC.6
MPAGIRMSRRALYILGCGCIMVFSIVRNVAEFGWPVFANRNSSSIPGTAVFKNVTTVSERVVPNTQKQPETKPLSLRDIDITANYSRRQGSFRFGYKFQQSQQTYMKDTISMYNGTDVELFSRCMNLSFPLTPATPAECWPRPVILASFPTSGNGLFRILLNKLTFPMQTSMAMYRNGKTPIPFYKIAATGGSINIYGSIGESRVLPLMNRVVVFKSHYGGNADAPDYRIIGKLFHDAVARKQLFGVLRIARNPGDNIFRNFFRWHNNSCYQMGDQCFFDQAPNICNSWKHSHDSTEYTQFHSTWNTFDLDLPQHVVHYEHITNKTHAPEVLTNAMEFLNSLMPDTDYSSFYEKEKVLEMTSIINEPDYEHGTVLARVCGKEIARLVNNQTQNISERLGYVFDYDSATWSLDPPKMDYFE